jgi:hypothetical protein
MTALAIDLGAAVLVDGIVAGQEDGQGLRTSLGRLGALGENGSRVSYSLAGRGSGAFFTIDRQDNPSSSGTSAP